MSGYSDAFRQAFGREATATDTAAAAVHTMASAARKVAELDDDDPAEVAIMTGIRMALAQPEWCAAILRVAALDVRNPEFVAAAGVLLAAFPLEMMVGREDR